MPCKFTISSSIDKEIQQTIVLVCLDMIYERGVMPKSRQEGMIYDFYHGVVKKDIVLKVDKFISTSYLFKKFWGSDYMVVGDDATVATPTSRSENLLPMLLKVPNKKTSATISEMYKMLHKVEVIEGDDEWENNNSSEKKNMPPGWFFPSWFAFAVFCNYN
eukprot:4399026-Ditylum_brightwellii.AAC.1